MASKNREFEIITSEVLDVEVNNISNEKRRDEIKALLSSFTSHYIKIDENIIIRTQEIISLSKIRTFDSLHLAVAESYADFFITVDKRLIKMANRLKIKCVVINPIDFLLLLREMDNSEYKN